MERSLQQVQALQWGCRGKRKKLVSRFFEKLKADGKDVPEAIGHVQTGKKYPALVKRGTSQGVFIYLNATIEARIKLSELPESPVDATKVGMLYPTGKYIPEVFIYEINNNEKQLFEASIKRTQGIFVTLEKIKAGDILASEVKRKVDSGLIVSIEDSSLTAFCYVDEIDDSENLNARDTAQRRKELLNMYPVGCRVAVFVLKVDTSCSRIWVTLKPSAFPESVLTLQEKLLAELESETHVSTLDQVNEAPSQDYDSDAINSVKDVDSEALCERTTDDVSTASLGETEYDNNIDDDSVDYNECVVNALNWLNKRSFPETCRDEKRSTSTKDYLGSSDIIFGNNDASDSDSTSDKYLTKESLNTLRDSKQEVSHAIVPKHKTRKKLLSAKISEGLQIRQAELEFHETDETCPETTFDFERLVQTELNSLNVWIRYIAYFLKMKDLEKARETVNRALEKIDTNNETERLNMWIAYLNLEATFGTRESLEHVLKRTLQYNDPKKIYLQMTYIHQRRGNFKECFEYCKRCVEKFPQSKKVWIRYLTCLFEINSLEESSLSSTVRGVLTRAMKSLRKTKQPMVICSVGRLEMKHGSVERGQMYFEKLLEEYPKRTDLWGQYLDAILFALKDNKLSVSAVRSIFKKPVEMEHMFKPRQMKYFYSRWLSFESLYGDKQIQDSVVAEARKYVEKICSSKS